MPQKYPLPPITEAVMQIAPPSPVDPGVIQKVCRQFAVKYPHQEELRQYNTALDLDNGTAKVGVTNTGVKFTDASGADIRVINPDAFTASRLAPYPGWDNFVGSFQDDLKIWSEFVQLGNAKCRVGLRYINRIDVPTRGFEFRKYFKVYPEVGAINPSIDGDFMFLYSSPIGDTGCTYRVNVATAVPPIIGVKSILLDIDIISMKSRVDEESFWQLLELMRNQKNEIFEACITDNLREVISAS